MPVGPNKTTAGLSGAIPQQSLTGVTRYTEKRLFYSLREQALILPKTIRGGYGVLEAGQVMAKIENTADPLGDVAQGVLVPYVPDAAAITSLQHADTPGAVPVYSAASTTIYCDLQRSWAFKVGDEIVLDDNDSAPEGCTITAIDRTSQDYQAKLTVNSISGTFTAAALAYIMHRQSSPDSSGGAGLLIQSVASYILEQTIDTGFEDQGGALGSVVVSNAILYQDAMKNCDAGAITDLSLVSDGNFYILK